MIICLIWILPTTVRYASQIFVLYCTHAWILTLKALILSRLELPMLSVTALPMAEVCEGISLANPPSNCRNTQPASAQVTMVPEGKGLSTDAHANHQNRILIVQAMSDLCHRLTQVNTSFSISAFDSFIHTFVGSKGNATHQTCRQIHILSVARQMCEWSGYIRVRENFSDTAEVCSCPKSSESQLAAPLPNPFNTSPWHLKSQKSATLLV